MVVVIAFGVPLKASQTQKPATIAPHAMPHTSKTKPTETFRTSSGAKIPPIPEMLKNRQPNPKIAVTGSPMKAASKAFRINRLIPAFPYVRPH